MTQAVEGAVIESMTDQELQDFVPQVSVYARVSPEHKIRIVRKPGSDVERHRPHQSPHVKRR